MIIFNTREDEPKKQGSVKFWEVGSEPKRKNSGNLAIQLSSKSGILTDHLKPEQAIELAEYILKRFKK